MSDEDWVEFYGLHHRLNIVKKEQRKSDLQGRLRDICRTTVGVPVKRKVDSPRTGHNTTTTTKGIRDEINTALTTTNNNQNGLDVPQQRYEPGTRVPLAPELMDKLVMGGQSRVIWTEETTTTTTTTPTYQRPQRRIEWGGEID